MSAIARSAVASVSTPGVFVKRDAAAADGLHVDVVVADRDVGHDPQLLAGGVEERIVDAVVEHRRRPRPRPRTAAWSSSGASARSSGETHTSAPESRSAASAGSGRPRVTTIRGTPPDSRDQARATAPARLEHRVERRHDAPGDRAGRVAAHQADPPDRRRVRARARRRSRCRARRACACAPSCPSTPVGHPHGRQRRQLAARGGEQLEPARGERRPQRRPPPRRGAPSAAPAPPRARRAAPRAARRRTGSARCGGRSPGGRPSTRAARAGRGRTGPACGARAIRSHACGEIATGAMPGGAPRHFCVHEYA